MSLHTAEAAEEGGILIAGPIDSVMMSELFDGAEVVTEPESILVQAQVGC